MKQINQFINEYIINKKLDNPIDSEDHYEYYPETKKFLELNIKFGIGGVVTFKNSKKLNNNNTKKY